MPVELAQGSPTDAWGAVVGYSPLLLKELRSSCSKFVFSFCHSPHLHGSLLVSSPASVDVEGLVGPESPVSMPSGNADSAEWSYHLSDVMRSLFPKVPSIVFLHNALRHTCCVYSGL